MLKTTDYDMFKFRADNREKIDRNHVRRLQESIETKNMLDMRPIIVNSELEVLDGQHRLLAAKAIGVPIYYKVEESLKSNDIIAMNLSKSWGQIDYLNYYIQNDYEEYKKLQAFFKKHQISLKVAINILQGQNRKSCDDFRKGLFKFNEEGLEAYMDISWYTIEYVRRMNGYSPYVNSSKFWKCLMRLFQDVNFNENKWKHNLQRMVERFGPRACLADYSKMMMEIHNYKNSAKVDLLVEE